MTEPALPTLASDAGPTASYLNDPELATLLSRLAALQGRAVPVYRFGTTAQTADGLFISDLPRHTQAIELWQAHFPAAPSELLASNPTTQGQFPLLWLSRTNPPCWPT